MTLSRVIWNKLKNPSVGTIINFIGSGGPDIDRRELQYSDNIRVLVDAKVNLLPVFHSYLNDRQNGEDILNALYEHRGLIHSLYYNKVYFVDQVLAILEDMEMKVRDIENGKIKRIK